jgi:uncharacterized integral membrane protein (TIGR00698 family)
LIAIYICIFALKRKHSNHAMMIKPAMINYLFGAVIFLCFLPFFSPAIALLTGIIFSFLKIRDKSITQYASFLLKTSIVLMGFGMNLLVVIHATKTGLVGTVISVTLVMLAGILIGRMLKTDSKISTLISAGTAICGASAIAAVAPVINAKSYQISFSLIVVFTLNGLALLIFPGIGQWLALSEETFGYWVAVAIHDTSSVVGAGSVYGPIALEIATTVKLVRALWIIPLALVLAYFQKDKTNSRIQIPWFIVLFALAIVAAHILPQWETTFTNLNWLGRRGMVIALFLVGANASFGEIKEAGIKSFALGIILWLLVSVGVLLTMMYV